MVDMKSFRVIIILSSLLLTNCASSGGYVKETEGTFIGMPDPISLGDGRLAEPGRFLWNHMQYLRFSLNDDEKKMHQSAVYHALDNVPNGPVTTWHSRERLAQGKVRVVHSFEVSNGYCRVYQALIEINGSSRHWTNKACKRGTSNGDWVFTN
jgi:hypothetical protein